MKYFLGLEGKIKIISKARITMFEIITMISPSKTVISLKFEKLM